MLQGDLVFLTSSFTPATCCGLTHSLLHTVPPFLPASSCFLPTSHPSQDDQDLYMGGWTPMKQTARLLNDKGTTASNWFIHTPCVMQRRSY